MLRRTSELQLESDASARFLPWVIAVMVFLAALALVGALAINRLLTEWRGDAADTATVQIAFDETADMDAQVADALELLRGTAGVLSARGLDREETAALLEPWLGKGTLEADLPLPRLIDVTFAPGVAIDTAALEVKLRAAVPGARLDDHKTWLSHLVNLARSIKWLAVGIVAVIGCATAAIIVFATRAGLAAHHEAIEVLHLIGARDGYIARQFQRHCMWLALKGGLAGGAAAALVLAGLGHLAGRLDAPLLDPIGIQASAWAFFIAVPFSAALLAMFTARNTVLRALKRLD